MIEVITETPITTEKIKVISDFYSKKNQWKKAIEEAEELLAELEMASNPFGYEDLVFFSSNMWSEVADVLIMLTQLIIQHDKAENVRKAVDFKLDRQLERMEKEGQSNWRQEMMKIFLRKQE